MAWLASTDRINGHLQPVTSCRYIKQLVEKEVAAGTPQERVVVGGFSQGGAIAIMMLRELKQLAGVIGADSEAMQERVRLQ
jgi:predicted esterase